MNWRILRNATRNAMMTVGLAGTVGFFAGSKPFAVAVGCLVLGGAIASLYFLEIRFRELRLTKGLY